MQAAWASMTIKLDFNDKTFLTDEFIRFWLQVFGSCNVKCNASTTRYSGHYAKPVLPSNDGSAWTGCFTL